MKLHLWALALALVATSCGPHFNPRPVSAGSIALLCAPAREVWCEWGDPECGSLQLAVQAINEAVPGLLVYKGEMPAEALQRKVDNEESIFAVSRFKVPADVTREQLIDGHVPLAQTDNQLRPWLAEVCVKAVTITIIWPHKELSTPDWNQVVLHELMHAVGAGHADPYVPFSTVMRPAINLERRVGLSKTDKAWLVSVYGS